MATEKKFNVRIQNKLDTYEQWIANDPVLKSGELALVSVSTAQDGTANFVPSIMAKCGDGTHKFSELEWLYTRSSDVYTWAKAATKPTYAANEITGIDSYIADYVNDQMGISVDTDTQYKLVKVDDYNYKLQSKGKTDSTWADVTDSVITIPNDTAAITALQTLVGDTAVATQIGNAIATAKSELIGSDTDTASSNTIKGAKKYAESLNTAMDTRVGVLETAVGTGGSVDTKISDAIGALDVTDTAEDGKYVSAVSEVDGKITVTRAALPDYTEVYAAKSHTHAIADVTGLQTELDKVTTLIGTDAGKSARTIANEELAAQLIPETAKESLDTLQEIAAWIQDHPDDASAMAEDIADLQTLVGDTSVSSQITTETNRAKAAEEANANAIATLNGTGDGSVAKAVSDAVAALDSSVSATAETDNQVSVLTGVTETDGKLTAKTEVKLAAIAKTGNVNDLIQTDGDVLVFDCGSSSVNV